MSTIKDTVVNTLGFHGQQPDAIATSIIDALEIREAQIQADLLKLAVDRGMYEDDALDALHSIFQHEDHVTASATVETVLASMTSLTRQLAAQNALLVTLV